MICISNLQRDTLLLADEIIEQGKTFDEVIRWFSDKGYILRVPQTLSGAWSKTIVELCKDGEYSFVDIKKKRNGKCEWQSIALS